VGFGFKMSLFSYPLRLPQLQGHAGLSDGNSTGVGSSAQTKALWRWNVNVSRNRLLVLTLMAAASPGLAQAELIYGLQGSDRIVSFDSASPMALLSNRAITGLGAGEVLVGLDVRPANELLYSLATNGNLYSFNDNGATIAATLIGNISTFLVGTNFGFDFIPTTDRLRVVNDGDQNLRLNPNNAVSIVDGTVNPSDLNLIGSAYTNSFSGATSTVLYGIDSLTASLMRSTNPNAGSYVGVGSLGLGAIDTRARIGLDISGVTGIGYLGYNDWLYTVDLVTGAATAIGGIGATNVRGLTVGKQPSVSIPEPAAWATMLLGFAVMGWLLWRRSSRHP